MKFDTDWSFYNSQALKAGKFSKDENRIIGELDKDKQPGGSDRAPQVKRLSDYTDVWFYSLGPVYVHCGVPMDIIGEFRKVVGYAGPRHVLRFNNPVIDELGDWGHVVEGIEGEENIRQLQQFMATQSIVTDKLEPEKRRYWKVKVFETLIADPIAVDNLVYNEQEPKPIITVFCPSGSRYELRPDITTSLPLKLVTNKSDPKVVAEARVVFSVTLPEVK
jgi:hypothetical protein